MARRENKPEVNLLELVPERLIGFETVDEERVFLHAPRFRARWVRRLIEPRMKKPYIRVKLDEIGSAVWLACDGKTDVGRIATDLRARFGEAIEPCNDRLAMFIGGLVRARFLRFTNLEECQRRAIEKAEAESL
jgi:hypothetical protein